MSVRLRFLLAAVLVVPACSSGSAGGPPVALAGDTAQGTRITLRPTGDQVAVRITLRCRVGGREVVVPYYEELLADVRADGRFSGAVHTSIDDGDGGQVGVDAAVQGRFLRGGRASGTVRAQYDAGPRCRSGPVRWTAAEPLVDRSSTVARPGEVLALVPDGDGVLALVPGGLVHVDGQGGATKVGDVPGDSFVAGLESFAPDGSGGAWFTKLGGDGLNRTVRHVSAQGQIRDVVLPELPGEQGVPVPQVASDVAVAGGATWLRTNSVTQRPAWRLLRLDTPDVVPLEGNGYLDGAGDDLWVLDAGEVVLVDGRSGAVVRRTPVAGPYDLQPPFRGSATAAWLIGPPGDQAVVRVGRDGAVSEVRLPTQVRGLAADDHGAWVSNSQEHVVRRIEGGRVVRTIDVASPPAQLAVDGRGRLWAATSRGIERIA